MMKRSEAGLTIIEVMMLGIVAAIAISLVIPRLRASRIVHNEEIAIAHFHQILEAQERWADEIGLTVGDSSKTSETSRTVGNGDEGTGPLHRYAYLDELVERGLLDLSNGRLEGGRLVTDGYVFEVFLFDRMRLPVDREAAGFARVDADRYLLMAWPARYGSSGIRAFAGFRSDVYHSSNSLHRYQGLGSQTPTGRAPLMPQEDESALDWLGFGQGADQQLWGPLERDPPTEE